MLTKKELSPPQIVSSIIKQIQSQKWIQIKEFDWTTPPYFKRIIITFRDKIKMSYPLTKQEYKQYRKFIETYFKTKK